MNFDDNDPLADLSDGSNDSFFDDPKPTSKRASLTKTPETKRSINDLFNIDATAQSKEQPAAKKTDDWLGFGNKSPIKTQNISKSSAKNISFDNDDDDILMGNLGLTTKRPQSRSSEQIQDDIKPQTVSNPIGSNKKLDLLESILGPTTSSLAAAASSNKKATFDDILKESKVKTDPPTNTTKLESSREGRREGRGGRRPSGGLMDPLGLFSGSAATSEGKLPTPTTKQDDEPALQTSGITNAKSVPTLQTDQQDGSLPDWLLNGRSSAQVKQSKSENAIIRRKSIQEELPQKDDILIEDSSNQTISNSILTQQKLAESHMNYQNQAMAMQQQESQLLMALQLKKYEDNLADIQMKQQDVLMKQEQQFASLLERQFAKQQIIENNMRLQQERINNHIQMLIAQPPITKHRTEEEQASEEVKKTMTEELTQNYESMISTLKQRQHEEQFLVEESYKKQINLLEQSLESVENRLKVDVEKLTENFRNKIENLTKQHNDEIGEYKEKIQQIQQQHQDEMKLIRENHLRVVDEIKFEHATLIENFKETKKSESLIFGESENYLRKLDSNIEILFSNSRSLQEIKENVEKDYGILVQAREESLKAKESEVALMKTTLEECRQSAETERAQLLALVRSLETKLAEQNQNAREERWAFQQAASTLVARSAALDRESEFNRNSIERERQQLQTLKESLLAEQEQLILQLTEEKLQISAQRSRLETSNKIHSNHFDLQKNQAEIDAAVQVAREATAMTDRERELLQKEKCDVEIRKRQLLEQERRLTRRENELDQLECEAKQKMKDGKKAMLEAKTMELKYNERLRELQSQLVHLGNREKKLAEEKISISRERLALNTMIRQTKKCSLCANLDNNDNENNLVPVKNDANHFEFVDPYLPKFDELDSELMRLRLSAIEDERNATTLSIDEK